jgi:PAT family beta-lactamase induction signal transducer AmpG
MSQGFRFRKPNVIGRASIWSRFTLLSALYLSQGLPYGFFTQALPVLLRKAELSLPMIGLANLLTLPWALKFLWAPAVDRWQFKDVGLRRSWLLPIQFSSVILFSFIAFLTPSENLTWVLGAFLLTNFLAAAQDIATDGLAVDMLQPKDRGWANGIQVAGYRIGMVIGGGALLAIYDRLQWHGVMFAMAAIALLCTLPVLAYREPILDRTLSSRAAIREIFHFLAKPGAWGWAAVLLLYKFGHASATGMLRPWLVDLGYSMTDIAWILGTAGFVAGFFGAMVGGGLAARFATARPRILIWLGMLQCLAVISYLWPIYTEHETFKIVVTAAFDHFTSGMATAMLFTVMMDACSKERAAADYTLQACLVVVAQQAATTFSGFSAGLLGYSTHFLLSAGIAGFAIAITALLVRLPKTRSLLQVGRALLLLIGLTISFAANAQSSSGELTSKNSYDVGVQGGVLLSRGIRRMTEPVPGWALRASAPFKFGVFEVSTFLGRGNGESYHTFNFDYRIDLELFDADTAHIVFGGHADYYRPIDRDAAFGSGWQIGAGFITPLAGNLALRGDFRSRFGPGTSLEILVGFNFRIAQ